MRNPVIVFARAPQLGKVKRRLARDIGDRAALRFHVTTLTSLLRALTACRRFKVILALTPDHARFRLPSGIRRINQGQGDLGDRMSRVLRQFRRVVLIGCDIPKAGAEDVRAAFHRLGHADAVFGPACDGGYWLIALGPRRPADLFGDTRWSTVNALTDTLNQFRHHRVGFIRCLRDVDTAADYHEFLASQARRSVGVVETAKSIRKQAGRGWLYSYNSAH